MNLQVKQTKNSCRKRVTLTERSAGAETPSRRQAYELRGGKRISFEGKFANKFQSVPLRRPIEMNFDGLFGVGDVKPPAVAFPTLGNHLDEHAAQRRIGNMRNAIAIVLHVQFHSLVFLNLVLFDVFKVDARIFNRRFFFAPRDFNRDPRFGVGLSGWGLRFRSRSRRILSRHQVRDGERGGKQRTQSSHSREVHHWVEHHPLRKDGPRSSLRSNPIGCLRHHNCCTSEVSASPRPSHGLETSVLAYLTDLRGSCKFSRTCSERNMRTVKVRKCPRAVSSQPQAACFTNE